MKDLNNNEMLELAAYWTRTQRVVAGFITAMVPKFHDAEDILQIVAMVLVKKYSEYDHKRSFLNWALGIARLEVLAYYRKQTKDRHVFDAELVYQIATAYEEMAPQLSALQEALRRCTKKVPARDQRLLRMWYGEQKNPEEISSNLGIAKSTVYVILHRIRVALKHCIQHQMVALKDF